MHAQSVRRSMITLGRVVASHHYPHTYPILLVLSQFCWPRNHHQRTSATDQGQCLSNESDQLRLAISHRAPVECGWSSWASVCASARPEHETKGRRHGTKVPVGDADRQQIVGSELVGWSRVSFLRRRVLSNPAYRTAPTTSSWFRSSRPTPPARDRTHVWSYGLVKLW